MAKKGVTLAITSGLSCLLLSYFVSRTHEATEGKGGSKAEKNFGQRKVIQTNDSPDVARSVKHSISNAAQKQTNQRTNSSWYESLKNEETARPWRVDLLKMSSKSKKWEEVRHKVTDLEFWYLEKANYREQIKKLQHEQASEWRPIDVIAAREAQVASSAEAADHLFQEYPALATLKIDRARELIVQWGEAVGLAPEASSTLVENLWGSPGHGQGIPSAEDYEKAIESQPDTVDNYFRDAVKKVIEMVSQEAFIESNGDQKILMNRKIYRDFLIGSENEKLKEH
jgi:hypothetical protein